MHQHMGNDLSNEQDVTERGGDDIADCVARALTDPSQTICNGDLKSLIDMVYTLAQARGEATVVITNPKEKGRTQEEMEQENRRWVDIGRRDYWPGAIYYENVRTLPDLATKLAHLPDASVRFLAIGSHGSEVGPLVSCKSVGEQPDVVARIAAKLANDAIIFTSSCSTTGYLSSEGEKAYVPNAFGATFIATRDVVFGWANSCEEVCPETKEYRDTNWDIVRPTTLSGGIGKTT
jgi:hypothetical protein